MRKISSGIITNSGIVVAMIILVPFGLFAQGGFTLSPNISFNYQSLPPSDLKEPLEGTPAGSEIPSLEFRTLNIEATWLATLPSGLPAASTTYHFLSTSCAFAMYDFIYFPP